MAPILVAYVTKYGTTKEVAETVGAVLSASGYAVDIRPAREVRDLSGYSAVVLGSALYFFMLHGDAKRFLARNRKTLAQLPVAWFALGPFNNTEQDLTDARKPVDNYLARATWLQPKSVVIFGGRHDPSLLRFPDNNPAMRSMPATDARDWDAIRAWAAGLPQVLGLKA
jgi:menaquinone-dependent protoporphyrinogen oxidase